MEDHMPVPCWSLDDLLPEGAGQLESIFAQIEFFVQKIESYRPLLTDDFKINDFLTLLHTIEGLHELTGQVGGYAYLRFAENTQDPSALSLRDQVEQILTEVDNRTMFFGLWFKNLKDEIAEPYIAASGELNYFLISLRRYKPYSLTEPEEKIINLKDVNGSEAIVKIYEILTNRLTFNLEVDGVMKQLTRDGLSTYYHHPSPQVRAATYQELYHVYGDYKAVIAQIYMSLVRDWDSEALGLRGYASPISVRNLGNQIQDPVVDTLLEVCRENRFLFQRYFRLKARLLAMDKLRRYDIYAPIARSEKTVEFDVAVPLVMDSFRRFSPQLAQTAASVFEHSHLDAQIRPGKRGGAFSYGVSPKFTPWVLLNFSWQIRDVTTLAHELGHAVHSLLASRHSILSFHPPLPLGETASVFAEMLVTDRLLQEESDPSVQRDLLLTILDDAYATVERQAYISIFEKDAHAKIAASCTSEELANLYLQNLTEQFGDALELTEEFAWEWLTIPHIFNSPFYPYAYSFGQLLVLALYQQYLEQREEFVPRYIKLLSYGGSAEPQVILAEAGIDISTPEFWQGGFDILQSMLDQLHKITGGAQ
jgi:oligoendopeptidase F